METWPWPDLWQCGYFKEPQLSGLCLSPEKEKKKKKTNKRITNRLEKEAHDD